MAFSQIMSARDFVAMQLPPIRWAVPELVPEGITLLTGPCGIGKSGLALSMAFTVSVKQPFLLQPVSDEGPALFVTFRSGDRKIQRTLTYISETMKRPVPDCLFFNTGPSPAEDGGLDLITGWLEKHPDARLVVIDTLQEFLPREKPRRPFNEKENALLSRLDEIAKKHHAAIVCIHDSPRLPSTDPIYAVKERFRTTVKIEAFLAFVPRPRNNGFKLLCWGREVDSTSTTVYPGAKPGQWYAVDPMFEQDGPASLLQTGICNLLQEKGPMSPKEIAETLKRNRNTVRGALTGLVSSGKLTRFPDGRYAIAETSILKPEPPKPNPVPTKPPAPAEVKKPQPTVAGTPTLNTQTLRNPFERPDEARKNAYVAEFLAREKALKEAEEAKTRANKQTARK